MCSQPSGGFTSTPSFHTWDRVLAQGGLSDSTYGRNRARLESWVRATFPESHLVVRLPGIFGPGMKKNIIFDLVTRSPWRHKINLNTRHQWCARSWAPHRRPPIRRTQRERTPSLVGSECARTGCWWWERRGCTEGAVGGRYPKSSEATGAMPLMPPPA